MPASAAAARANRSLPSRWWRASIAGSLTERWRESFTMPDLLVAGTLHTLHPARPVAQAVLIRDGRFAKVGTREECERASESDLRYIELGESCAVPGRIQAHGHPLLPAPNRAGGRLGGASAAH